MVPEAMTPRKQFGGCEGSQCSLTTATRARSIYARQYWATEWMRSSTEVKYEVSFSNASNSLIASSSDKARRNLSWTCRE